MKDKVITESKKEGSLIEANSLESHMKWQKTNSNLVIEDNTIYEIDEDCMNCLKKEKNLN